MGRRRVMVVAAGIAVLAAVAPLIGIAAFSRHHAFQDEHGHLVEYAGWTLKRTERNFAMARQVFAQLEKEAWRDCSAAHVSRMRQLTIDTRSVDEIGFFIDGRLACTSWGDVQHDIPLGQPDARLPDGFGLYLDVLPEVTDGAPVIALARGSYNVLMRPERLVDVLTDTQMTLGVATVGGRLVAMAGTADPVLVDRIAREGTSGRSGTQMYASVDHGGLRAFAITDRSIVEARMDRELWYFIPIGLAISAVLVGLVVWICRQRLSPHKELELAIRRREFVAFYQPIIEIATGACVGAEAVVRWRRPEGGWVAPDLFVHLAEQTGLVEPLTSLMIDRVADDLAHMLKAEPSIHIAINVSAADLHSGRFLAVLSAALTRSGIAPSQIWLEATERGFMNAAVARNTIEQARAAGHTIAIDDFGTGYSSLSLLETLPLDVLKIDKSFVDAIGTEAATSAVIPHIIGMAHELGFSIVAEGVETVEQEAYLAAAGVQFVQGWLHSKALSAADFLAYFENRKNGAAGLAGQDVASS